MELINVPVKQIFHISCLLKPQRRPPIKETTVFIMNLMRVYRISIFCDMKVCFVAKVESDSKSSWGHFEKSTKIKEFFH